MKNFSLSSQTLLTLFSEQISAGDKEVPAVAAPEKSIEVPVSACDTADTGAMAPAAGENKNASKSRREIYDEFIRANKDFYAEDTQKIISLRLKEAKDMKEALKCADEKIKSLEYELESGKRQVQAPDSDFISKHPDFNLQSELENETFKQLYENGVSVSTASHAAHFDQLLENAAAAARKEAVKAAFDTVRAKGVRIREAASSGASGLNIRHDVSRLTKKQRAEIARRVIAGEDIVLS